MGPFFISLLTQLTPILLSWLVSRLSKKQTEPIPEAELDQKLSNLKTAYSEALDGKPVTKEQRDQLNKAISDLIHSANRM